MAGTSPKQPNGYTWCPLDVLLTWYYVRAEKLYSPVGGDGLG